MSCSSKCFVPGCRTGYQSDRNKRASEGKKALSLFSPPKDLDLLEKWTKAISRTDKQLTRNYKVCELHFKEDDIDKEYKIVYPDGTIYRANKQRIGLKQGAIPSIFPNQTNSSIKRENLSDQLPSPKKVKTEISYSELKHEPEDIINVEELKFSFTKLLSCIDQINKPNKLWGVTSHEDFIMCVKWNEKYFSQWKIIFDKSLNLKIFLNDKEVSMNIDSINCIDNVSSLLQKINDYTICEGAKHWDSKCKNYFESSSKKAKKWCCDCLKAKKREFNSKYRKARSLAYKYKKLYLRVKSEKKKNSRLKGKVALLKKNVELARKECSAANYQAIESAISSLPEPQQECIKACLKASKIANHKGIRYTTRWIYECFLMRIKSKKLYEHIRNRKILPLPSLHTLNSYIKRVQDLDVRGNAVALPAPKDIDQISIN